jgi:hypothetical protein
MYRTFIKPVLEYGYAIEILSKSAMDKLQKIQNLAFRKMFSAAPTLQ